MHVDYERLACELLGCNSGQVGKPVVGVDEIELILVLHCDGTSDHCIPGDFLHQVGAIASRETELLSDVLGE